jgi:hypothetical protein
MMRTEGEVFPGGEHSGLRLSFPAGRGAVIIALTWANAVQFKATTLMQFSVLARRLHSL